MKNAITWFEIPTTQLDRAQALYEALLGQPLHRENMGPSEGAVFAYDGASDGVGGALMMGSTAPQVSGGGTLVFLDASPSLDSALERVVAHGGTDNSAPLPPRLLRRVCAGPGRQQHRGRSPRRGAAQRAVGHGDVLMRG